MLNIILLSIVSFCQLSECPILDYTIDSIFINTDKYSVICEYPVIIDTNNAVIGDSLKKYAIQIFNENQDFMIEVEDMINTGIGKYFTEFRIEEYYTTEKVISVLYLLNSYTGGAHGIHNYYTFNYDRNNQRFFTLKDIISENDLKVISEYCRKNIAKQKQGNNEEYQGLKKDEDLLMGTEAKWENFERFLIVEKGIKIIFNEYRVAPYYMGAFEVLVPISVLKNGDN